PKALLRARRTPGVSVAAAPCATLSTRLLAPAWTTPDQKRRFAPKPGQCADRGQARPWQRLATLTPTKACPGERGDPCAAPSLSFVVASAKGRKPCRAQTWRDGPGKKRAFFTKRPNSRAQRGVI